MVSCDPKNKAARLDRCGKCNGNNTSCQKQREVIWARSNRMGNAVIYTFPIGATHIKGESFSLKDADCDCLMKFNKNAEHQNLH